MREKPCALTVKHESHTWWEGNNQRFCKGIATVSRAKAATRKENDV